MSILEPEVISPSELRNKIVDLRAQVEKLSYGSTLGSLKWFGSTFKIPTAQNTKLLAETFLSRAAGLLSKNARNKEGKSPREQLELVFQIWNKGVVSAVFKGPDEEKQKASDVFTAVRELAEQCVAILELEIEIAERDADLSITNVPLPKARRHKEPKAKAARPRPKVINQARRPEFIYKGQFINIAHSGHLVFKYTSIYEELKRRMGLLVNPDIKTQTNLVLELTNDINQEVKEHTKCDLDSKQLIDVITQISKAALEATHQDENSFYQELLDAAKQNPLIAEFAPQLQSNITRTTRMRFEDWRGRL